MMLSAARMAQVQAFVESERFRWLVLGVIGINALTLGIETDPWAKLHLRGILDVVDGLCTFIFVIEIALKLVVYRRQFFSSAWNVFDFLVVFASLMPNSGPITILRIFRVFRVFRLFSVFPAMRRVIEALGNAIPGMGAILAVLLVLFYVAAVMTTQMFSAEFATEFGSIGASAYTLFQIMTLDGWSSEIVRPVLEKHPLAWMFFLPFIVLCSFAVLNMFIAVIVEALQEEQEEQLEQAVEKIEGDIDDAEARAHREREELAREVIAMRADIAMLTSLLRQSSQK